MKTLSRKESGLGIAGSVVGCLCVLGLFAGSGCATYDEGNRPSGVQDQPIDPDRQRVDEVQRDIGRDTGLMR